MNKELIEALRLGEAGCLVALCFEPITSNHNKWEKAAAIIRQQRESLENEMDNQRR